MKVISFLVLLFVPILTLASGEKCVKVGQCIKIEQTNPVKFTIGTVKDGVCVISKENLK